MIDIDIKYMHRALQLASMGEGNTRPNPMVGAVIVHNGHIIGEGFHSQAGMPHAEVVALGRVADRSLIRESDLYVSLEPCSHWGRTPPCAEMIVREGFSRVVIGTADTSAKVSGKGIEIIKKGGCDVKVGVLEEECRHINRRFFCHHEKGRPYIILKWAQTDDGFFDVPRRTGAKPGPNWITGKQERVLVHKWRSEEHSVMIGENTLYNDDPSLDVRFWTGIDPLRIVMSDGGTLKGSYRLLSDGKPTLVYTSAPLEGDDKVEYIRLSSQENSLSEVMADLYRREVQSLLVEGGSNLLAQFIKLNLWDEARIFTGCLKFGSGLAAPEINGTVFETAQFETSILRILTPV